MKNFFLTLITLALLASLSAIAQADDDSSAPAADSMFVKLQTQFAQGAQADLKSLIGKVDSGRCFSYEAPDNPIASALNVINAVVDNGPLGSGTPTFMMSVSADPSLAANYFDQASVTDMNVDPNHLPLKAIDAKTYEMNLDNGSTVQFRAVGSTVVAYGKAAWGDATLMCYYFKPH